MNCECKNWAGNWFSKFRTGDGIPIPTNHHPNCPHYNDSLMDAWEQHPFGMIGLECYSATEPANEFGISKNKIKMHREVFENLPEFAGF